MHKRSERLDHLRRSDSVASKKLSQVVLGSERRLDRSWKTDNVTRETRDEELQKLYTSLSHLRMYNEAVPTLLEDMLHYYDPSGDEGSEKEEENIGQKVKLAEVVNAMEASNVIATENFNSGQQPLCDLANKTGEYEIDETAKAAASNQPPLTIDADVQRTTKEWRKMMVRKDGKLLFKSNFSLPAIPQHLLEQAADRLKVDSSSIPPPLKRRHSADGSALGGQGKVSFQPIAVHHVAPLNMMENLDRRSIEKFRTEVMMLRNQHVEFDRNMYISEKVRDLISIKMESAGIVDYSNPEAWRTWNDTNLFEELRYLFPEKDVIHTGTFYSDVISRVDKLKLVIDFDKNLSEQNYIASFQTILRETNCMVEFSEDENLSLVKYSVNRLSYKQEEASSSYKMLVDLQQHLKSKGPDNVRRMLTLLQAWIDEKRVSYSVGDKYGWHSTRKKGGDADSSVNPKTKLTNKERRDKRRTESGELPSKSGGKHISSENVHTGKRCDGCGRIDHIRSECKLNGIHPDFNLSGKWEDSKAAKTLKSWKVDGADTKALDALPFHRRLDGSKFDWNAANAKATTQNKRKKDKGAKDSHQNKKKKGECNTCSLHRLYLLNKASEDAEHTVKTHLIVNDNFLTINVLLDTGALQGNYVSLETASWMQRQGVTPVLNSIAVCGAFDECKFIKNEFSCKLKFFNFNKIKKIDILTKTTKLVDTNDSTGCLCQTATPCRACGIRTTVEKSAENVLPMRVVSGINATLAQDELAKVPEEGGGPASPPDSGMVASMNMNTGNVSENNTCRRAENEPEGRIDGPPNVNKSGRDPGGVSERSGEVNRPSADGSGMLGVNSALTLVNSRNSTIKSKPGAGSSRSRNIVFETDGQGVHPIFRTKT